MAHKAIKINKDSCQKIKGLFHGSELFRAALAICCSIGESETQTFPPSNLQLAADVVDKTLSYSASRFITLKGGCYHIALA